MARDLSQAGPRVVRQNRPTTNRDTIIPTRRSFEAGRREVNADVRNAAVGDRGARELLEIFGGLERTANSFQQYASAKYEQDDQNAAARGAADAATGAQADPELEARFGGYRKAYSLGKAQMGYFETFTAAQQEIADAVANGADVETADGILAERLGAFLLDEQGKPRDFGTPEANAKMAQLFAQDRAKFLTEIRKEVKDRTDTEMVDAAGSTALERFRRGDLAVEDMFAAFPPDYDKAKAKAVLADMALTAASEMSAAGKHDEAIALIKGIETSKRADGTTPSWSPAEREKLVNARLNLAEAKRKAEDAALKERQEATENTFLDRMSGADPRGWPSAGEISAARRSGLLDARTALTFTQMINNRAEAAASAGGKWDPDEDPNIGAIQTAVLTGRMSGAQAVNIIKGLVAKGTYGDGDTSAKAIKAVMGAVNAMDGLNGQLKSEATRELDVFTARTDSWIATLPKPKQKRAAAERDRAVAAITTHWIKGTATPGTSAGGQPLEKGLAAAYTSLRARYK